MVRETPVMSEIKWLTKVIALSSIVIGVLISLLSSYSFMDMLVFTWILMIANLPEGIIATLTIMVSSIAMRSNMVLI